MQVFKCTYPHFRNFKDPLIVGNCSYNNGDLIGTISLHLSGKSCQRHWRSVNLRHIQSTQNDFIEFGIGSSCKKLIQLQKNKSQVNGLRKNCRARTLTKGSECSFTALCLYLRPPVCISFITKRSL